MPVNRRRNLFLTGEIAHRSGSTETIQLPSAELQLQDNESAFRLSLLSLNVDKPYRQVHGVNNTFYWRYYDTTDEAFVYVPIKMNHKALDSIADLGVAVGAGISTCGHGPIVGASVTVIEKSRINIAISGLTGDDADSGHFVCFGRDEREYIGGDCHTLLGARMSATSASAVNAFNVVGNGSHASFVPCLINRRQSYVLRSSIASDNIATDNMEQDIQVYGDKSAKASSIIATFSATPADDAITFVAPSEHTYSMLVTGTSTLNSISFILADCFGTNIHTYMNSVTGTSVRFCISMMVEMLINEPVSVESVAGFKIQAKNVIF